MDYTAITLVALIIAVVAFLLASLALVTLIGLKTSTHRIEYVDPFKDIPPTEYSFDIPEEKLAQFPIHPEKEDMLNNHKPQQMSSDELAKYFASQEMDE